MRPQTLKYLARSVRDLDWGFCTEGFGQSIARRITQGDVEQVKSFLEYRKSRGSLSDYMMAYALPKTVLATEKALRRVAFEVCEDNYLEGVRYLELRFNPWMLTEKIKPGPYIKALADGLDEAAEKYPELETVLLLSLVKSYDVDLCKRILEETLKANSTAAVAGRIKGVDSAGNEVGWAPSQYEDIFEQARQAGLGVVSHAGEAFASLEDGITMIEEAIDCLGAGRIGHGLAAGLDGFSLRGSRDLNGEVYTGERVEKITERQVELRKRLREKDILIEVCPSSNIHTGNVRSIEDHPVSIFLAEGIPFSICTDNRWISHTKLSWEYLRLIKVLKLSDSVIDRIVSTPFRYRLEDLAKGSN